MLSWLITKFLSARTALINCSLGIVMGWALIFTGAKTNLLVLVYLGLFISGTMCGLTSPLSSIYITELAGTGEKGLLASMNNFNINFGILFINILGSWIGWGKVCRDQSNPENCSFRWNETSLVLMVLNGFISLAVFFLIVTPEELADKGGRYYYNPIIKVYTSVKVLFNIWF